MNTVKGFTLIEVIVAVLIVAILASIAVPSYQSSVRKARRADAQAVMLELSQWMERFYTVNHRYDQTFVIGGGTAQSVATLIPSNLLASPKDQTQKQYTITLTPAITIYSISATPTGTGSQTYDQCGAMTLRSTGVKCIKNNAHCSDSSNSSDKEAVSKCW